MLKGQQSRRFGVMHLKEFTQTNQLHILGVHNQIFASVVYSESCLKVEKSSKSINTMNGTILFDAINQNPASICALEK